MDTIALLKFRCRRSGLRLTPIAWVVVALIVFLIFYRFYNMSERRTTNLFPARVAEPNMAVTEKKYELEMKKNMKAAEKEHQVPKVPLFDHDLDPKANLEFVKKPHVKEFPVKLLQRPKIQCENSLLLVILVSSDMNAYEMRSGIRQTWGRQANYPQFKDRALLWQTIFTMGASGDEVDDVIAEEAKKNGDIIQGEFRESEYEATRKFMMGVTHIVEKMSKCRPKFLLQVRDHEYVNLLAMIPWLNAKFRSKTLRGIYMGKKIRLDQPIRDETHPLYVPRRVYPPKYFPDLILGPVYLFSYDVIEKMRPLFGVLTPLAMDDGYIGILMKRLGIKPRHSDRFNQMRYTDAPCRHVTMILVFKVTAMEQLTIFDNVKNNYNNRECQRNEI